MTQPERFPPEDPREWLIRARSNLQFARASAPGVLFEDRCFEAQQAAEKSIKAVMISRGIDFPYTHNLAWLLRLVERDGGAIPPEIREAERLTPFAMETRYPGPAVSVTESDYNDAVAIAEAVVAWAEAQVGWTRTN